MRVLCLLIALATSASATFTSVQTQHTLCGSSTTCSVTVTSTGTGHLLVVGVATTGSQTVSSVSGGGTWTHPAGCAQTNATAGSSDAAYALTSTSGSTTVTVTLTAAPSNTVLMFQELSYTGTLSFDHCSVRNETSSLATIPGATQVISGTNDSIFQIIAPAGGCSGINSSFTGILDSGAGMGYLLNTTSTTVPGWTGCSGSIAALSALTISETTGGGGGGTNHHPRGGIL